MNDTIDDYLNKIYNNSRHENNLLSRDNHIMHETKYHMPKIRMYHKVIQIHREMKRKMKGYHVIPT